MDVDADTQATETQATSRSTTEPSKEGGIPQELLRKYILWAREHTAPKLGNMDEDKIARLFADMRRESLATGAYPITVRPQPIPFDSSCATYLADTFLSPGSSLGSHYPHQ